MFGMFCNACGHANVDDAVFCNQCGKRMAPPAPVRSGAATEVEVWTGTMSWKGALSLSWLFAFVAVPVALFAAWHFAPHASEARRVIQELLPFLAPLPLVLFSLSVLARRATSYRLTTDRLSVTRGLLARSSEDIPLVRVEDVQYAQSLLHRLLNVGTIRIASTDKTQRDLLIPGVPDPVHFKEKLWHLVRERRQSMVYVEQLNN